MIILTKSLMRNSIARIRIKAPTEEIYSKSTTCDFLLVVTL